MTSSPKGHALVVTMTGNRKGWQADVKKIHQLFLYLDIKPEYLYDLKGKVDILLLLPGFNISKSGIGKSQKPINIPLFSGINPEVERFCF